MMDINVWLAEALAPVGLPACEEPMREQVTGAYLTWEQLRMRTVWASGKPFARMYDMQVYLWAPVECDWQALREMALKALKGAGAHGVMPGAASWQEQVGRRCVMLRATLMEE